MTSNTSDNAGSVPQHALGMLVEPSLTVANTTGTTSFFLTKGAPCQNKRLAVNPVSVTLPDGQKIMSTHVCNIIIPGLPTVLTGHIMPDMTTASFFGIRVLCKAQVLFDNDKCQVIYKGKLILTGYKDPVSNLWIQPILPVDRAQTTLDAQHQSPVGPCMSGAPHHAINFPYHHMTKENNVNFMHQSLCNPPKSLLLAAIQCSFLRGAPHLSKKAVAKYLMPSPAKSKGYMKQPRKGIQSTTLKAPRIGTPVLVPDPIMPSLVKVR